jgi:hypothetical protein
LGNRIFDSVELEIVALQQLADFVSLPVASKSDIRQALRLYTAFLNETPKIEATKKGRLRRRPQETTICRPRSLTSINGCQLQQLIQL